MSYPMSYPDSAQLLQALVSGISFRLAGGERLGKALGGEIGSANGADFALADQLRVGFQGFF